MGSREDRSTSKRTPIEHPLNRAPSRGKNEEDGKEAAARGVPLTRLTTEPASSNENNYRERSITVSEGIGLKRY